MVEGLLKKHTAELQALLKIREPMTDVEMELLSILTQGLTTEQIGERLSMSKGAVDRQFIAIKKKLDIYDIVNLVQFAKDYGFIVNKQ